MNQTQHPPQPPVEVANSQGVAQAMVALVDVVAKLRHPTEGCPWDLKQTHQSLAPYMLEEAYEAVETMAVSPDNPNQAQNPESLKDELGDVLLQVILHAQVAQDAGTFTIAQVCDQIREKLIRRHPHVFGTTEVDGTDDVVANWEAIKAQERQAKAKSEGNGNENEGVPSILAHINRGLPALSRAHKMSRKAVKVGFKWPTFDSLWQCVMGEYDEFRHEADTALAHQENPSVETLPTELANRMTDEMGDILFATVSLSGHFGIDPEVALHLATEKFKRRFQAMEQLAHRQETPLEDLSFEAWDTLWKQAKTELADGSAS